MCLSAFDSLGLPAPSGDDHQGPPSSSTEAGRYYATAQVDADRQRGTLDRTKRQARGTSGECDGLAHPNRPPRHQDTWREEADEPIPELEQDDEEFEIEKVLRWRYYRSGNKQKKEYLVVWKGWPLSDATWLPMEDIRPRENFENMIERDNPVQDTGGGSSA